MKISILVAMIYSAAVWIPSSKGAKQSGQNQRLRTLSTSKKDRNRFTTTTSTRKIQSEDDSVDDDIDYFYSMSYSYSYNESTSKGEEDSLDNDIYYFYSMSYSSSYEQRTAKGEEDSENENDHFYSMSYSYSHSYSPTSDAIPDRTTAPSVSKNIAAAVPSTDRETPPQVDTHVPTITHVVVPTNATGVSDAATTAKSTIPAVAPTALAPADPGSASDAVYPESNADGFTVVYESQANNTRSTSRTHGVVAAAAAGLIFAGVVLAMVRQRKKSPSDDLDSEDFIEAGFI